MIFSGHELLTPVEMQEADQLALGNFKVRPLALMENAGRAVVAQIVLRYPKGPVAVLCGPGNNGGDGFVVARLLAAKKWPVRVFLTVETATLQGDAAAMCAKWKGQVHAFAALGRSFEKRARPTLIVDAIFGAGLNREFPANWASAIMAAKVPIVAVDVPSGLDGRTGRVLGHSVAADLTVTFFRKRPGHVLQPGRGLCGDVVVCDIGVPDGVLQVIMPKLWENTAPVLPMLLPSAHKFTRGHALIWSGPELATGAARLAAQAAARSGAGLVSLVGPTDALRVQAAHVTSIMLKPVESDGDLHNLLADKRTTAMCIGPGAGAGPALQRKVLAALKDGPALVLDADALTSFAEDRDNLFSAIQARGSWACVFTPHEGEFARLFKELSGGIDSKVEVARRAAALCGAVVVLKGPDTVIASPDGRAVVNSNAPAKLATAGSGDVLAGIITGLLAQGWEGFEAACAGVWLHGEAANAVPRRTLIAEDLIEKLGM